MNQTDINPLWSEKMEIKKRVSASFILLLICLIIGLALILPYAYLTNTPGLWFKIILLFFLIFFIVMTVILYLTPKKQKDTYVKIFASGIYIGNDYKNELLEWDEIKQIKLGAKTLISGYARDNPLNETEKIIRNISGLNKIEIVGTSINPGYPAWVKHDWLMANKELKYARILSITDKNGFLETLKKINKYSLIIQQ